MALSSGTLNPEFDPATAWLNTSVPYATSSVTVTPTSTVNIATIRVNELAVTSGGAIWESWMSVPNTITVLVTAPDGTTTKTYTLTVTRLPASTVSTLSGLVPSSATLCPAFSSSTADYTLNVSNTTTSLTIQPTVTDAAATVKVNGISVTSGTASPTIPLVVGPNTITTVVTAQDGTTTTYTVIATRAPSAISTLSGLVLNAGTLISAFSASVATYTANVSNSTSSVTIQPTVTDATATAKVNGISVTSGSASETIPLLVGPNSITAVVTAQDGTTTTYTVTLNRAPSTISTLSSLVLNSGAFSPAFASTTTGYAVTVTAASLTVTPTVTDATATVKVNGSVVSSGAASDAIPLALGTHPVLIVVTAQDGVTQSNYTVMVTRLSTVSTLSDLTLSSGTLSPAFSLGTTAYTASVQYDHLIDNPTHRH